MNGRAFSQNHFKRGKSHDYHHHPLYSWVIHNIILPAVMYATKLSMLLACVGTNLSYWTVMSSDIEAIVQMYCMENCMSEWKRGQTVSEPARGLRQKKKKKKRKKCTLGMNGRKFSDNPHHHRWDWFLSDYRWLESNECLLWNSLQLR